MGRAFGRLQKQVSDRVSRERFINYGARLETIETYLYELGSYLAKKADTSADADFLASHEEFRHFLERVVKQNG